MKVAPTVAVVGVVALVAIEFVREWLDDGIRIDPVVVKVMPGDSVLTPELAAQQIAGYLDAIQRSGAAEWKRFHLQQDTASVNVQIPGTTLTVESIVQEVARLIPMRRRILKVSITPNTGGIGYAAEVVTIAGATSAQDNCGFPVDPDLAAMFGCIAVKAMSTIDLLHAVSYVLDLERKACADFVHETGSDPKVQDRNLQALRMHCGFARTRSLTAQLVSQDRAQDRPWVPYVYGQLHLARAQAFARFDRQMQVYEYDRAIDRFREFGGSSKSAGILPSSALATEMQAMINKGVALHEVAVDLQKAEHGNSRDPLSGRVMAQLDKAKTAFDDADKQLDNIPKSRLRKIMVWASAEPLDAFVAYLQGEIHYRQWMLLMHRRTGSADIVRAAPDGEEQRLLETSISKFQESERSGQKGDALYMDWGNALRVMGRFDDAITKYRRAGEIAPGGYALLNIAIALMEREAARGGKPTPDQLLDSLGHVIEYLSWRADESLHAGVIEKVAAALEALDKTTADQFRKCVHEQYAVTPDQSSDLLAFKVCVDETMLHLAEVARSGN
jgi:tetratricopeptide (TPR) repeat protein